MYRSSVPYHTVSMVTVCLACLVAMATPQEGPFEYVIVGAGPAGLQMGYFLQEAGRDYVILERANVSGSFFQTYPRHGRLISINKRHTGQTNREFNLRHDWNSLLNRDPALLFREYSKEFFPDRAAMTRYLADYSRHWGLRVRYNTAVVSIDKLPGDGDSLFRLRTAGGDVYFGRTLLMATGLWKPNVPDIPGLDLADGYEEMSVDPEDYEGKSVLILGHGNSAFETAHAIYGSANLVHLVGRSRVRLSWETHYVGDVRGVNNNLLDTYQLKSLDGLLEGNLSEVTLARTHHDKISVLVNNSKHLDNFALRLGYDKVIRCLGFTFDSSLFNGSVEMGRGPLAKFPRLTPDYQSTSLPGMYVIGTAAHSLDFKKSAGGFIHGLRYTVRALHHILEWRHHAVPWPATPLHTADLLPYLVKRINEASGTYQMFGVLCDVIVLQDSGPVYLPEYPVALLPQLPAASGLDVSRHIVVSLEYGRDYSGPGKDVFREGRATGFPEAAHRSNFLHPVLYYYEGVLTDEQLQPSEVWPTLPRPARLHHMVEDFLTDWSRDRSHILHLRRFLEVCLGTALVGRYSGDCFLYGLTTRAGPVHCQRYLSAEGVSLQAVTAAVPL